MYYSALQFDAIIRCRNKDRYSVQRPSCWLDVDSVSSCLILWYLVSELDKLVIGALQTHKRHCIILRHSTLRRALFQKNSRTIMCFGRRLDAPRHGLAGGLLVPAVRAFISAHALSHAPQTPGPSSSKHVDILHRKVRTPRHDPSPHPTAHSTHPRPLPPLLGHTSPRTGPTRSARRPSRPGTASTVHARPPTPTHSRPRPGPTPRLHCTLSGSAQSLARSRTATSGSSPTPVSSLPLPSADAPPRRCTRASPGTLSSPANSSVHTSHASARDSGENIRLAVYGSFRGS